MLPDASPLPEPVDPAGPADDSPSELRWRIPTTGDPALLRIGMAQVGLATLVAALIILLSVPAAWRGPALAGLVPLAVFVAYRRWLKYRRSMAGEDNVRLDSRGLFWRGPSGPEQSILRDTVVGFRLGREPDTLRPVTALTLYLAGGFESQPIELHPPATSDAARRLLTGEWQLVERTSGDAIGSGSQGDLDYHLAIDVYSECHDDYQEWHLEGSRTSLGELLDSIAAAAAELPAPPPGAKPLGRVLLLRRRQPLRLTVAHDLASRFDPERIAAPAEILQNLAQLGREALAESTNPYADRRFNLRLAARDVWTFHLHLRDSIG